MPCRSTERSDEIFRWIDHFEASKVVPMHTVNLDVDSLGVYDTWYDDVNKANFLLTSYE